VPQIVQADRWQPCLGHQLIEGRVSTSGLIGSPRKFVNTYPPSSARRPATTFAADCGAGATHERSYGPGQTPGNSAPSWPGSWPTLPRPLRLCWISATPPSRSRSRHRNPAASPRRRPRNAVRWDTAHSRSPEIARKNRAVW